MKSLILSLVIASVLPAASEPMTRCVDALCANFQQEVSLDHQHSHRCADALCVSFQQFVAPNHRHLHRNSNATSPNFQQSAPEKNPRRR